MTDSKFTLTSIPPLNTTSGGQEVTEQTLKNQRQSPTEPHTKPTEMNCFKLFITEPWLICELIVYEGIRRLPTFSNDFSPEAVRPFSSYFTYSIYRSGGTNDCVFCSGRIRTLIAMATYILHRLKPHFVPHQIRRVRFGQLNYLSPPVIRY